MIFRNAPVMIMDEPTAALDVEREKDVFRKLINSRKSSHQSALVISHRLTAVKHVDKILLLDEGVLVEQGSHADLIERAGLYAKMYKMYSEAYER